MKMKYSSDEIGLTSINFVDKHTVPVNNINSAFALFKTILYILIKLKRKKSQKKIRTKNEVIKEYNSYWGKIYETKFWKEAKDFEAFNFQRNIPGSGLPKYVLMRGKLCEMSEYNFFKYQAIICLEQLKKFTQSNDVVVEVGCGWGINLFNLVALNFKNKLEGYDLTDGGIKIAREINKQFNCNITLGMIDLTTDFSSIDLTGKTVFTHYTMEQMKYDTAKVIENLIKSKPKQVLHFEPIMELHTSGLRDRLCKMYIKSNDYQDNLLTTLKSFEKEGKLEILDIRRLGYGAKLYYETSFIHWIPKV
jgi:hypothetical protein